MGLEVERDFVELGHIFLEQKRKDNSKKINKNNSRSNLSVHMLCHRNAKELPPEKH